VSKPVKLTQTSVRLFSDDIEELKKAAAVKRSKWQTELRHLVHRALGDQKKLASGGIIR
jgi:predicted DNA binding CopG/RHH family protein